LRLFGALTLAGSLIAGGYYFLFMRSRNPQIELYFDDGSMLALPGDAEEAQPFMAAATDVLKMNPIAE
jgi:hypothetical protein